MLRSLGGLLEIGWACAPEAYHETQRLVLHELERFTDNLTEEDVDIAKQAHVRGLQMDVETTAGLCILDVAELLERGRRFDLDLATAELMRVSTGDVKNLARRVLDPQTMAMAVCGPEELNEQVS